MYFHKEKSHSVLNSDLFFGIDHIPIQAMCITCNHVDVLLV